jgi:hypothetical protein
LRAAIWLLTRDPPTPGEAKVAGFIDFLAEIFPPRSIHCGAQIETSQLKSRTANNFFHKLPRLVRFVWKKFFF